MYLIYSDLIKLYFKKLLINTLNYKFIRKKNEQTRISELYTTK